MGLDDALRTIEDLQRQLDAVPVDDFEARYALQRHIDDIRANLPVFDKDAGRSREDLEEELEQRRRQLDTLLNDSAPPAPMGDGEAFDGHGIDDIRKRIGEIESALSKLDN